ncbi:MAG: tRNA ((37)-N6)-dimethylallyltransferase MiaA [Pseudomonadota bacterium]|jgi:tRNA dimethylallyltransferase
MPLHPHYLCLAGPTASGKTAAALAIAQEYDCEIISVDSALVYRGMDIGTAKPSAAELAQVPHHLIDIRDPLNAYSAAEFVRDATTLIEQIAARGKLPLLVGGTMLYFKALFDGLDAMPTANAAIRAAIEQEAAEKGWAVLHAQLAEIDPITAARLAPADSQRIQRALEVFRVSGLPISHFQKNTTKSIATNAQPVSATGDLSPKIQKSKNILISLEPENRTWLHQRIAQRFDSMLQNGFIDEVRRLEARGDLHADLPSIRCVGYRQLWHESDIAKARELGIIATRQLAKRQITWLRSMPQRHAIAADSPTALQQVLGLVKEWRFPA